MTYAFPMAPAFSTVTLRRELDRFFDEAQPGRGQDSEWQPAVSIREDAGGYTVLVDLPGVDPSAVELVAEDGTLTVRGARAAHAPAEGERMVLSEQSQGRFARRFRLPKAADQQAVTASYALGVLTVRIAKVAPAQPRRVPITVHG